MVECLEVEVGIFTIIGIMDRTPRWVLGLLCSGGVRKLSRPHSIDIFEQKLLVQKEEWHQVDVRERYR